MPERRIETTTSRTAEWTCVSRAASSLESDSCYRSDDHIALQLVPTFLRVLLHIPLIRRFCCQVIAPKGIYEYTIARTKYIDGVFKDALAKGFDQILIFGAGFDTRALRFRAETGDTKIFELDVPITQRSKLDQYTKRGLHIPANVTFISVDFDRESLSEKLEEAEFVGGQRSLFVLEGLVMYLQAETVDETFKVIERFAAEGSEVVFDYVRGPVLRQEGVYYGERGIFKSVAKAGERWNFGIEDEELEQFLKSYSLIVNDRKCGRDLEQLYFTNASGDIMGRVNATHCLVRATKSASLPAGSSV